MPEKIFTITTRLSGFEPPITEEVKESNLTKAQQDLLFAELLDAWNNSPAAAQVRLMNTVVSEIKNRGINDAVNEQQTEG